MPNSSYMELETIPWLNAVDHRASTASTNDLALSEALAEGDGWAWLFVADEQTAGRGRRGNAWWAGSGALTFSLVIDAAKRGIDPAQWPLFPLATGLAVRDTIGAELPDESVLVKWPNDVYLNGRKAAGILVEQRRDHGHQLVIGVGINVNTEMNAAPDLLPDCAISLRQVSSRSHELSEVLVDFLLRFDERLRQVVYDASRLLAELNDCSHLTGRRVRLDAGGRQIWGHCRGIAENGGLLLATADGMQTFVGGTVGAVEE